MKVDFTLKRFPINGGPEETLAVPRLGTFHFPCTGCWPLPEPCIE